MALDKVTNAVGRYFKGHAGDLVETFGDFAMEWPQIRNSDAAVKN